MLYLDCDEGGSYPSLWSLKHRNNHRCFFKKSRFHLLVCHLATYFDSVVRGEPIRKRLGWLNELGSWIT